MSRARNRWLPAGVALAAAIALGWATRRQTATWHDSESLWTRAHALEPGNALAAMNLGVVRAEQAEEAPDPARSIALCDEALALYDGARATSDDPRILLNASHAWTQIANLDAQRREAGRARALEDARLALAAAGEQGMFTPEYRFQYGTALVNAGRLEDGIEHLEWYAKARPGNVRGLLNLGVAWIRAGRPERALPVVERACRLAPSEPFAWELLANACEALGRAKDEAAAWKHVLALAPAHARAQERLAALGAGH
jgi:predicted Zn-dependent protease